MRKAGPDVDFYNVSTYQCSILLNNMCSFKRKSEFRKAENMDKPISLNEKFNVTNDPQLSLLREFGRNNYAHVILTAEVDSLPTDEKELLNDCGLVGCHSSKSNDRNGHAAILEVKFGKKKERAATESRERSAEQLFDDSEPAALAVEGSDLGTSVASSKPAARCTNDTKKRQLVIRSGLP